MPDAYYLACFYKMHIEFLLSHIYLHLDNSKLWKQCQSVREEMLGADMQFRKNRAA